MKRINRFYVKCWVTFINRIFILEWLVNENEDENGKIICKKCFDGWNDYHEKVMEFV